MPSIFDAADCDVLVARIRGLRPDAKRQWGKMDVAQMLAHLQMGIRTATGEVKLKRVFIGYLFGRLAKKSLTSPKDWKRGLPTDKSFVIKDARDFAVEQKRLVDLVTTFSRGGPAGLTSEAHPFFGPLTTDEWDALTTRHIDHHLRQFGA
jgi:hypothetical protein